MSRKTLLFACVFLLLGCSPYAVPEVLSPKVESAQSYRAVSSELVVDSLADESPSWWTSFRDPVLDELVTKALRENFSLKAAWNRLQQFQAAQSIAGSELYPQLSLGAEVSRAGFKDDAFEIQDGTIITITDYDSNFVVRSGLSYELDLWKRIASQRAGASARTRAALEDVQQTGLLLSGSLVEEWFTFVEQNALRAVLNSQLESSKTLLELIELRFAVGRGTALDVLQQRQLLSGIESEIPIVESRRMASFHRLATLLGEAPSLFAIDTAPRSLPDLPPPVSLISPIELLESRPDLRASRLRLLGAEYDVASALAERFPRLQLGFNYSFSTQDFSSIFDREAGNIVADLLLPIIDGGRRRAAVRQQEAIALEGWNNFAQEYLTALREVETALTTEAYQEKLLRRLRKQFSHARATLAESKSRYVNGLGEYIDVIVALQSVQAIERRVLSEHRSLLVNRARLLRALGGYWQSDTIRPSGLTPSEVESPLTTKELGT